MVLHSLLAGGGIYYSDILGSRRDYDGGLFTCARITVGIVEGGSRNQQWLLTGSVAQFLLSSAIRALFAFLLPFSFLPLRPTYSPSLVQYSQTFPHHHLFPLLEYVRLASSQSVSLR